LLSGIQSLPLPQSVFIPLVSPSLLQLLLLLSELFIALKQALSLPQTCYAHTHAPKAIPDEDPRIIIQQAKPRGFKNLDHHHHHPHLGCLASCIE
jgi:hypothetical protein